MTSRASIRIDFDDKPSAPREIMDHAWPVFREAIREAAPRAGKVDALEGMEVTVTLLEPGETPDAVEG